MRKLENYTDEEWSIVSSTPQLVGMAMAGAASSGLVGSTKEMFANARGMVKAKKEYTNNALIQAVLPDSSDPKKTMDDAKKQREIIMAHLKKSNVKSSGQLAGVILEDCSKVIAILEQKESSEVVSGYKKWLLEVAEEVANAAKEGDFLGFGGERFSEKEQQLFAKLKNVLN